MAKKRKSRSKSRGFSFDLEDDAEQIFLDYLDSTEIPNKDEGAEDDVPKSNRVRQRGIRKLVVDLHGYSLAKALEKLEATVEEQRGKDVHIELKVITGKGLHSGIGGGVLSKEAHIFMSQRYGPYIVSIDESPDDLRVGGVPIRGHFLVELKF